MSLKESLGKGLAKAGRIGRGGWGGKIAIGILIAYLETVTTEQVLENISSQKDLFDNIPEEEWVHYRETVEGMSISSIDTPQVTAELKKRRLDLLQIITNTKGGVEWLENQLTQLREKLGLLTE